MTSSTTKRGPIRLTLTQHERALAHEEAKLRARRHDRFDLQDHIEPADRVRVDYCHASAEILFARHMGLAWRRSNGPRKTQLDSWRIHTTEQANGHLLVRPDEPEHLIHVLVTGPEPDDTTFTIVGHIIGADARRLYPLDNRWELACHAVPKDGLTHFALHQPTSHEATENARRTLRLDGHGTDAARRSTRAA